MTAPNSQDPHRQDSSIQPLHVLRVDSSARGDASVTRQVSDVLIEGLGAGERPVDVTVRDLAAAAPSLVHAEWVAANFTPAEERAAAQHAVLAESDALVAELVAADVIVIGVPIYNFGVPAALKAWVDMVARARLTFRYTEHGPEGLLHGKRAYLVAASGGVPVGSEIDFATGYLRHLLGFLGIEDVEIIAADGGAVDAALDRIAQLLPAGLSAAARIAA